MLAELKGNEVTESIPLIAVSGNPDIGDTQRYLDAGFADTRPKPIDYTDLMMKIARALDFTNEDQSSSSCLSFLMRYLSARSSNLPLSLSIFSRYSI